MTVYLLAITPPHFHAKHYIGWCEDGSEGRRLARHRAGRGAKLITAAVKAGCSISMVYVWPGATRQLERKLKKRRDTPRWCPHCGEGRRPIPDAEHGVQVRLCLDESATSDMETAPV